MIAAGKTAASDFILLSVFSLWLSLHGQPPLKPNAVKLWWLGFGLNGGQDVYHQLKYLSNLLILRCLGIDRLN